MENQSLTNQNNKRTRKKFLHWIERKGILVQQVVCNLIWCISQYSAGMLLFSLNNKTLHLYSCFARMELAFKQIELWAMFLFFAMTTHSEAFPKNFFLKWSPYVSKGISKINAGNYCRKQTAQLQGVYQ